MQQFSIYVDKCLNLQFGIADIYKVVVETKVPAGVSFKWVEPDSQTILKFSQEKFDPVEPVSFKTKEFTPVSVTTVIQWYLDLHVHEMFDRFILTYEAELAKFDYPAPIAKSFADSLRSHCLDLLAKETYNYDLVIDNSYKNKFLFSPAKNPFKELVELHNHGFYKVENDFSRLSRGLPGMDAVVECPVKHDTKYAPQIRGTMWRIVQHLNDKHKWTREKIADWIDELHDSGVINIEFDVPLEGGEE